MATFDINKLLGAVFNYRDLPFPSLGNLEDQIKNYGSLGSLLKGIDASGLEYHMPVTINDMEMPNAIVGIGFAKDIVTTKLRGVGGTMKEDIGMDDYAIRIRGVIIQQDEIVPQLAIKKIKDVCRINDSLKISSALTDIFLDQDEFIVIKDVNFPAVRGMSGVQPYDISAVSDKIFELEIVE